MTDEEIADYIGKIDGMNQEEMCRIYRFAESGSPYFIRDTEVADYFDKKFHERGGMTPEISKKLGW